MSKIRTLILGAAGRDFHNFNVVYRNDPDYEVAAFTATQIPDIDGRMYPPKLAGDLYPEGIPILSEEDLEDIIRDRGIELCVMSYSDLSNDSVMELCARVNSAGSDFTLLGAERTMLRSSKPVISVCAVRTGCGKSQTTRRVIEILQKAGRKVVAVRHPMPYGDLVAQRVQRFEKIEDLKKHNCTIEEMEEYEPHIRRGNVIYAGVDYEAILREAEKEADIILWDGGNNDTSFYRPDLLITVVDPHRPGHEVSYYPGQTNLRMADVVVINKIDSAYPEDVDTVRDNIRAVNPEAVIVDAASPITVDDPSAITGASVLVVEDGPTLTHGDMEYGAGFVAAEKYGAEDCIDPRPYAVGTIIETYEKYYADREDAYILPAMGYGEDQMKDLQQTINASDCDTVIIATPIDLTRVIKINKPVVRVGYDLQEIGKPDLPQVLRRFTD
ncbi:MAG: GTPase [Candidatus Aegiribacteria sp. MLS_C]|nr:MAG: GTPase [Candidatus Aegiribacteria sp. MLS_C]